MENPEGKIFPTEPTFNQIIKELETLGYVVVDQKPDQDSVVMEGSVIPLPLTNMSGMKVILRKSGDVWTYVDRCQSNDLDGLLRAIHKSEKSGIE